MTTFHMPPFHISFDKFGLKNKSESFLHWFSNDEEGPTAAVSIFTNRAKLKC